MKELLLKFQTDPDFQKVMDWVLQDRPQVPPYQPGETTEEEERNTLQWKAMSLRQSGFDIAFRKISGRKPV